MKKSSKDTFTYYYYGIGSLIVAIIGIFMPFAAGVSMTISGNDITSADLVGYALIFGNSHQSGNGGLIAAWAVYLVGIIFLAAAIVSAFLLKKKSRNIAIFCYGFGGLLLVAGGLTSCFAVQLLGLSSGSLISYKMAAGFTLYYVLGLVSGAMAVIEAIEIFRRK